MKSKTYTSGAFLFIFIIVLVTNLLSIEAQIYNPNGKLRGIKPPRGRCNGGYNSESCNKGKLYPFTSARCEGLDVRIKATLTLNSFQKGGEGGRPSACDGKYHSDSTPVVALLTERFNNRERCLDYIVIHGNGRSAKAKIVDECDSTVGCDAEHDSRPPCPNNIVDTSKVVWKALRVKQSDRGEMEITSTSR